MSEEEKKENKEKEKEREEEKEDPFDKFFDSEAIPGVKIETLVSQEEIHCPKCGAQMTKVFLLNTSRGVWDDLIERKAPQEELDKRLEHLKKEVLRCVNMACKHIMEPEEKK